MAPERIIIGSRGSDLAMWQAHWVQAQLQKRFPGLDVSIEVIKTKGDKILDSPLSKIGDKGLFTREIEAALLTKQIDLAVHSLKDLPTQLPSGLMIGAISEREDVRDVFIPHPRNNVVSLKGQPQGAKIATGSLRRKCQLLNLRPDLEIIDIRGNLNTRMKKLEESDWSGMMLARAGVVRLGWQDRIGDTLDAEVILPAVGQGALGIEIRVDDNRIARIVKSLHHYATAQAALAERALLRRLEGGCQVPIGTYGRVASEDNQDVLRLDAIVGSLDGKTIVRGKIHGSVSSAEELGTRLAETLIKSGADRILESIRTTADDAEEVKLT
ncbi:MAG: hydroxymethylbilane synthase [Ignavibacteriae bacterium]|nr:hydroxymethylbilane synthase [Ignavibacteriota bacterium]